jgi:hypothetical protein
MAEVIVEDGSLPIIKFGSDKAPSARCDACHAAYASNLTIRANGFARLVLLC